MNKEVIKNKDVVKWHELILDLPKTEKEDLKEILSNNFFPQQFENNFMLLAADKFGFIQIKGKKQEFSDFFSLFLGAKIKLEIIEGKEDFQSYDEFFKQKKEQEKIDLLAKVKKNPKHKLLETMGISLNEVKIKNS